MLTNGTTNFLKRFSHYLMNASIWYGPTILTSSKVHEDNVFKNRDDSY